MATANASAGGVGQERSRKDKNQNIQVFARLRPLNARERDIKSIGVVEVAGSREIIVRQPILDNKLTKKFTFDRVFGPNSKQVDVYQEVVSPLIEEVLAGYNCTVFAYGQTGTGKTHTMVGESSGDGDVPWQNDPMAGIIPRSLSQLFDELRITNSEYTVRVSYLELYNEELFDLLSTSDDNSKLRIYEDVTRKGSNIVNGLEEMTVYNKNEVYKIMAKGQEKRRMASTLMNAQSSRSHTVFTIVVHMKENSPEGEELMKIGKLNLVDLAGSENISKAGTDNPSRKERARECVNINQSLLTLGRVITALVERHPHIPYRESKLTRLLQESLGGRTKTSIIATISPGHRDVEETLSTLEYAHRARNIQNKPEINQKLTKKAVLKEYSEEIDRLKRDLQASRDRNGVYLANETYAEMTLKLEEQEKEIQEQILFIKALKEERDKVENLFNEMSNNLKETENQLDITNKTLDHTKVLLSDKHQELVSTRIEVEEQKHLVSTHVEIEVKLSREAKELLNVADTTTNDIDLLHNTLEKKRALEGLNLDVTKSYGSKSLMQREKIKTSFDEFTNLNVETFNSLHTSIDSRLGNFFSHQTNTKQIITEMFNKVGEMILLSENNKNSKVDEQCRFVKEEFQKLKDDGDNAQSVISEKIQSLFTLIVKLDESREKDRLEMEDMKKFVEQWKHASKTKLLYLKNVQSQCWDEINTNFNELKEQHESNSIKNVQEIEKARKLRKQHNAEFTSDLVNLRLLVQSLEEKHNRFNSECDAIEEENESLIKKNQNTFARLLTERNESLIAKKETLENTLNIVENTNKTFVNDMFEKINLYGDRVASGSVIDKQLKDTMNETNDISDENHKRHREKLESVTQNVIDQQSRSLTSQHEVFKRFLEDCEAQSGVILQPIEDTLNGIDEQRKEQQIIVNNFEGTMSNYMKDMTEAIEMYNDMEYKFLNEEYRLYSPTGKTPIRKGYMYPSHLSATSPHERILKRYRNIRNKNKINQRLNSPTVTESDEIITLDETVDMTPLKCSKENSKSDSNLLSNLTSEQLGDSPETFVEPKSVNVSLQSNVSTKSPSENNIFMLSHKSSKENLNYIGSDKKDKDSRIRQPATYKKVLGSKN